MAIGQGEKRVINYSDFEKVDIRVGVIVGMEDFSQARKLTYKLKIDFGGDYRHQEIFCSDYGALHAADIGRQAGYMAVINFRHGKSAPLCLKC